MNEVARVSVKLVSSSQFTIGCSAQMVMFLSFLSSTEQQQNNVMIVAVLAEVLTSFPYSWQKLQPPAGSH